MFRILAFNDQGYTALVGPSFPDVHQARAFADAMELRVFNAALNLGVDPTISGVSYLAVEKSEPVKHDYRTISGFTGDQLRTDCSRNYGLRELVGA